MGYAGYLLVIVTWGVLCITVAFFLKKQSRDRESLDVPRGIGLSLFHKLREKLGQESITIYHFPDPDILHAVCVVHEPNGLKPSESPVEALVAFVVSKVLKKDTFEIRFYENGVLMCDYPANPHGIEDAVSRGVEVVERYLTLQEV